MADIVNLLAAAAGAGGEAPVYEIERSLRFNSADSAYLSRTPASAGNRKTFTWSCWIKRGSLGSVVTFFSAAESGASNPRTDWQFNASNALYIAMNPTGSSWVELITTPLFRDPSAWYHIVVAIDTTQATSSNRTKLYVNGTQVTSFSTEQYPSQNTDLPFNNTWAHSIGRYQAGASAYFNGYMTEIHFVDGQALTPSAFGKIDATTGVWVPKAYAGTYGTNGFYLDFADNTSGTTIGYDVSGNGNNWTSSGISVSAGAGNDSLVDTPTLYGTDNGIGGEVRGNYATLNPLAAFYSGVPALSNSLTNGNLQVRQTAASYGGNRATIAIPQTGKWYFEVTYETVTSTGSNQICGIIDAAYTKLFYYDSPYTGTGLIRRDANLSTGVGVLSAGTVLGFEIDSDSLIAYIYVNGVKKTSYPYTMTAGIEYFPAFLGYASGICQFNFGQRPFAYTAPSGYKALCTTNLAEGTITTSGTFTGNGSTNGPFVYLNGVPTAMTINGNAVTFGTHADKLSNGFKVRSSSASYNANGSSMSYTISTTGAKFKYANAQPNP